MHGHAGGGIVAGGQDMTCRPEGGLPTSKRQTQTHEQIRLIHHTQKRTHLLQLGPQLARLEADELGTLGSPPSAVAPSAPSAGSASQAPGAGQHGQQISVHFGGMIIIC